MVWRTLNTEWDLLRLSQTWVSGSCHSLIGQGMISGRFHSAFGCPVICDAPELLCNAHSSSWHKGLGLCRPIRIPHHALGWGLEVGVGGGCVGGAWSGWVGQQAGLVAADLCSRGDVPPLAIGAVLWSPYAGLLQHSQWGAAATTTVDPWLWRLQLIIVLSCLSALATESVAWTILWRLGGVRTGQQRKRMGYWNEHTRMVVHILAFTTMDTKGKPLCDNENARREKNVTVPLTVQSYWEIFYNFFYHRFSDKQKYIFTLTLQRISKESWNEYESIQQKMIASWWQ